MFESSTGAALLTRSVDDDSSGRFADLGDWVVDEFDDPLAADDRPPGPAFADCEPSGWLGLDLDTATTDLTALPDESLIGAMVGFDRMMSWAGAKQARLFDEFTRRRPGDPVPNSGDACVGSRFVPDEVGVALKLSRGTAKGRVDTACRLLRVLPATHTLWETGQIDTAKATAIADATVVLPDDLAAVVEARVLPRAPQQSLQQLRAALGRAILALDPEGVAERHRRARDDRRVSVQPEADGMGSLWALLTATDAQGAFAWLTRLARALGADDPRSMDQRRADLLADLLNGRLPDTVERVDHHPDDPGPPGTSPDEPECGEPECGKASSGELAAGDQAGQADEAGRPGDVRAATHPAPVRPVTPGKPLVQIVMSHSTLTGADDQPAELVGHGPIPADLAREIAADAVWHRLVTDPLSGTLLDYGRSTYHPPAALADFVRARDQHCRFPYCRRKAADAELDHVTAWADGGTTSAANLRSLCVHHHKLKTHAGWRVEAHPDGRLTWITPTGHRHTTEPHDHRPDPVGSAPFEASRTETTAADPDPPPF